MGTRYIYRWRRGIDRAPSGPLHTMCPSPLATTSINGSRGAHQGANGPRPHGGSSTMTYISLPAHAPSSPPSFRLRFRSPCFARPFSAPTARLAFGQRSLGSEPSHTMAAVRPKLAVLPSGGADNAWSRTSSSKSDFLDLAPSPASPEAKSTAFVSALKDKVSLVLFMAPFQNDH